MKLNQSSDRTLRVVTVGLVILVAVLLAIGLSACTKSAPPAQAQPEETVSHTIDDAPGGSLDEATQLSILDEVWDEQGSDGQSKICYGWNLDASSMLDAFMSKASGTFDRDVARTFFEGKCS